MLTTLHERITREEATCAADEVMRLLEAPKAGDE